MEKALLTFVALTFVVSLGAFAQKAAKVVKISGEVVKVDVKAGTISIKAENKVHALKAEAKLLEGINAGDKVEAEVAGGKVKSIKKATAPEPAPAPAAPAPQGGK